jgi:hypothetical protein
MLILWYTLKVALNEQFNGRAEENYENQDVQYPI